MKNKKTVLIYCSNISHTTPPFFWYTIAQKLSLTMPVIFIELPSTTYWTGLRRLPTFFIWFIKNVLHQQDLVVWNFSFGFSKHFLYLYLLFLKTFLKYQIVLYTNMPQPYDVYRYIPHDKSFYNCTDKYYETEFSENQTNIKQFSAIFADSLLLLSEMKKIVPSATQISSGYYESTPSLFPKFPQVPKSIIFSGGISHRIDFHLLIDVVNLLPDYHFFFRGEVYLNRHYFATDDLEYLHNWETLLKAPNVHYLGPFLLSESTKILPIFKVGIIPYDISDHFCYHSNPIKVFDYLSAGLPIVSTPIPTVIDHSRHAPIYIAHNAKEMSKFIIQASQYSPTPQENHKIEKLLDSQSVETKVKYITNRIRYNQ